MNSNNWKAAVKSNKDDWETPQSFFNKLNEKYHFTFDLAASKDNTKCDNYFDVEDDSLSQDWSRLQGNLFLNPPYNRQIKNWIKKAYETSLVRKSGGVIVMLIPSRTDTSYWHDFIFNKARINFLRGRLKFEVSGKSKDAAPFPSAVIIYGDDNNESISSK